MGNDSTRRSTKIVLSVATVAGGLGALIGFPAIKAWAQDWKQQPEASARPTPRTAFVRPSSVHQSSAALLEIAREALANPEFADRVFNDPGSVAKERGLRGKQRRVLAKMDRAQFETAKADAASLVQMRRSQTPADQLPSFATDAGRISEQMVVGRAILAAAGRNYLDAANAHACCPWSKGIELGTEATEVLYDQAIRSPN